MLRTIHNLIKTKISDSVSTPALTVGPVISVKSSYFQSCDKGVNSNNLIPLTNHNSLKSYCLKSGSDQRSVLWTLKRTSSNKKVWR